MCDKGILHTGLMFYLMVKLPNIDVDAFFFNENENKNNNNNVTRVHNISFLIFGIDSIWNLLEIWLKENAIYSCNMLYVFYTRILIICQMFISDPFSKMLFHRTKKWKEEEEAEETPIQPSSIFFIVYFSCCFCHLFQFLLTTKQADKHLL